MNRLARERSPYLLQHASNPVDWFPWGDEAFAKARTEEKPIFLSVGYSTCHWCHVMERESFESEAIARVLNDHFISIKVDREERPDVDRMYMMFVQTTTGSGGWPLSVWLTPELKPFYGGTYFPPESRWGRPGFADIVEEIARMWREDRPNVARSAEASTKELRAPRRSGATDTIPGADALARALDQFREAFDARRGGCGDAPKFPRPSELLLLLREHARTGDADALQMVLCTLQAIAKGGIRDHVGGGFHRYAVDGAWRVPHFEKMLYDQAQLVLAFCEAAQVTGDGFYAEVAEDTLRYVQREMTDPAGGFYSAEDADSVSPEDASRRAEGAFYVWRVEDISAALGEDAAVAVQRFGIDVAGNVPVDPHGEFAGRNILYVARSVDDLAREIGMTTDEVVAALDRVRCRLLAERARRPRPALDDKVLTAWNGLMIGAFARASRLLDARSGERTGEGAAYLRTAQRAAAFIRDTMWDGPSGRLQRRYRDGSVGIEGYAEDFAYLVFGLLELFQADADPAWLEWAVALQRRQDELFWDEADGGWFSTTGDDPSVLVRLKDDYDGAEPSVSSISVLNLVMLSHLRPEPAWTRRIERTLRCFGAQLNHAGRAMPMLAAALSTYTAGVRQVIIVGDDRAAFERTVARRHLPFTITISVGSDTLAALGRQLPFVAAMHAPGGSAAAYVCRDFACSQPVTTVEALEKLL